MTLTDNTNKIWESLKNLSNEEKLILIAKLSESMMKPSSYDHDWERGLDVESFRKRCKEKVNKLYG